MGKKKENILDYLATGKEEIIKWQNVYGKPNSEVHIATATGHYNFPPTYLDKDGTEHDYKEELLRNWNSINRGRHDLDSVRIVRCCTDKEDLKKLLIMLLQVLR